VPKVATRVISFLVSYNVSSRMSGHVFVSFHRRSRCSIRVHMRGVEGDYLNSGLGSPWTENAAENRVRERGREEGPKVLAGMAKM